MQTHRLLLLASLLLVIFVCIGIAIFLDHRPAPGSEAVDSPAATSSIEGEVGEDLAAKGQEASDEATGLVMRSILFIIAGISAGIILLTFVIPWAGDAIGTFFYSAPEEVEPDPSALAVAKVAQGDYEGAIAEYQKLIDEHPMDRFPVVEVANLYMSKLDDPDRAVNFLEVSLNDKEWPVDDAAYLMFRCVEIELEKRDNPVRARELLELIVENFEGTRHSANAQHRIEQIDAGTWATSD